MKEEYFEYIPCPVCNGEQLEGFFKIAYGKLKQKRSLDYSCLGINKDTLLETRRCKECKFVFVNPRVRSKYAHLIYNQSKEGKYAGNKRYTIDTAENRDMTRQRKLAYFSIFPKMLNYVNLSDSLRLLDVGCGFGHVLSLAGELGIEGIGVDIDEFRLEYCRGLGLKVFSPSEFKADYEGESFDLIVCQSVIEHVIDLNEFLSFIDSISKENTILYLNGISPHLISKESKKGRFVKAHFVEHINYFYDSTLDLFMGQAGFAPASHEIIILNSRKIRIPLKLARVIRPKTGFFEKIYIKESCIGEIAKRLRGSKVVEYIIS
ncbi:MAG: class I SAM-dependent methyltransferase [Planctomycetes bacterium]|nr:class I SAM-dependent methyltransferase [Planctomycetota bacterium]